MQARAITALIRRSRAADVIEALWSAGIRNVSTVDMCARSAALEPNDRKRSLDVATEVAMEVKLELICDNETQTAEAIALIRDHAKTGEPYAGRIYISALQTSVEIGN